MTGPSWTFDRPYLGVRNQSTLTLWIGYGPDRRTITLMGFEAEVVVDALSALYAETERYRLDHEAEPDDDDLRPDEATLQAWARTLRNLADEIKDATS